MIASVLAGMYTISVSLLNACTYSKNDKKLCAKNKDALIYMYVYFLATPTSIDTYALTTLLALVEHYLTAMPIDKAIEQSLFHLNMEAGYKRGGARAENGQQETE